MIPTFSKTLSKAVPLSLGIVVSAFIVIIGSAGVAQARFRTTNNACSSAMGTCMASITHLSANNVFSLVSNANVVCNQTSMFTVPPGAPGAMLTCTATGPSPVAHWFGATNIRFIWSSANGLPVELLSFGVE